MAYTIPVGAVAEVSIEGTHNGQQIISLFHYRVATGSTIPDGAAAMNALLNWVTVGGDLLSLYLACLTNQIDDMRVYGQWIAPTRYRYLVAAGGPFVGTGGANSYPQNVAAAITKFGENANRRNIGTLHMPGVPLDFIAAGEVTAAGFAAYDALAGDLSQVFVGPGGNEFWPVIFNRTTPSTSPRIIGAFTQPTSRTSRRRTVGLGA